MLHNPAGQSYICLSQGNDALNYALSSRRGAADGKPPVTEHVVDLGPTIKKLDAFYRRLPPAPRLGIIFIGLNSVAPAISRTPQPFFSCRTVTFRKK
jgi:hypothetical protein